MEKISRKEAKELGFGRYFTGKPCKHGHVAERYVSAGRCVVCAKDAVKTFQAFNPLTDDQKSIIKAKSRRKRMNALAAKPKVIAYECEDDNTIITGPTNTYWEDLLNLR